MTDLVKRVAGPGGDVISERLAKVDRGQARVRSIDDVRRLYTATLCQHTYLLVVSLRFPTCGYLSTCGMPAQPNVDSQRLGAGPDRRGCPRQGLRDVWRQFVSPDEITKQAIIFGCPFFPQSVKAHRGRRDHKAIGMPLNSLKG